MTPPRAAAVRVPAAALVAVALAGLLAAPSPAPVEAAVIVVTSFEPGSGPACTLSNAIRSANDDIEWPGCVRVGPDGADTIVLPTGLYALTDPDNGAGADLTGLPAVRSDITILGNGSTIARVGDRAFRIFRVEQGRLTLRDLAVSGGLIRAPGGRARGGGIRVLDPGSLTLDNVTVSGNAVDASGGMDGRGFASGGGIHFSGDGTLKLTDTSVVGNRAIADGAYPVPRGSSAGGGIAFFGSTTVTVTRGAVRDNIASADVGSGPPVPGAATGGGIHVTVSLGGFPGLALSGVVVSGNTARAIGAATGGGGGAAGGGVFFETEAEAQTAGALGKAEPVPLSGGLVVSECTFSDNRALASGGSGTTGGFAGGGGLFYGATYPGAGHAVIERSAFVRNAARADGGATGPTASGGIAEGGGISFRTGALDGGLDLAGVTAWGNVATAVGGAGGGTGPAKGGAIAFESAGGLLSLTNATVTGNEVVAPGPEPVGAGIAVPSSATLQNSIVSGNTGGLDCTPGSFTSLGNNIIPPDACGTPQPGDRLGVSPELGPLVDLGRPAGLFLPPLPTSPAIDGAEPAACPATDQVGQGRHGPCDIGAVEAVPATAAVASILPSTRAGMLGSTLTAFVSVINAGPDKAYKVGIRLVTGVPALFAYRTTDPKTNAVTGAPNTPVDIEAGQLQTYVIAVTPTGPFDPTDLAFAFEGTNTAPVASVVGLNTLLVSASPTPIPDLIALAATRDDNGIMDIAGPDGAGFYTVATFNLGAAGAITVSADTGAAVLPVTLLVCQTNANAECVSDLAPDVTVPIGAGEASTFSVFAEGSGPIPFDPAASRVFFRLKDATGATRGGTSVAVRTVP